MNLESVYIIDGRSHLANAPVSAHDTYVSRPRHVFVQRFEVVIPAYEFVVPFGRLRNVVSLSTASAPSS